MYALYESVINTGALFHTPLALDFNCDSGFSYTILSHDGYNALYQISPTLPSDLSELVCRVDKLFLLVRYYLNLEIGLLMLLPLHYLLVVYESCKSKTSLCSRLALSSLWIDSLLMLATLAYLLTSCPLFERYEPMLESNNISHYFSFISELNHSKLTYHLGSIFLLLMLRLLHSLRFTPLCGHFCFTLSALFRRAFILLLYYFFFLTLAALFLYLLISQTSSGAQSLQNCFNILLLKSYEAPPSLSRFRLIYTLRFISFILFPSLLFALYVVSIPSVLRTSKLHYRQQALSLQYLHLSTYSFLTAFDFPLSILSYFFFLYKCCSKSTLPQLQASKRNTQRILYLFSIFVWSALLLVINLLLLLPAYLIILTVKWLSICRATPLLFTHSSLMSDAALSSKHCNQRICSFVFFLLFGLPLLLLRVFSKFCQLIKWSCSKDRQRIPERGVCPKTHISRKWLQQLVELSSGEKNYQNYVNFLRRKDGEVRRVNALNLKGIKKNWQDETNFMKIEKEEADLIIRADTSFSNSDLEQIVEETRDTGALNVMDALMGVSGLLSDYETQDLLSGERKIPSSCFITLIQSYLHIHDLHQRAQQICQEGGNEVWMRHSWQSRVLGSERGGYDGIVTQRKVEPSGEVHQEEDDKGNQQSEVSESAETRHTEEQRESEGEECYFVERYRAFLSGRRESALKIELDGVLLVPLDVRRDAGLQKRGVEVLHEMMIQE